MGMDVYGKNQTSEKGSYFRNNVWWWRPLWNYCEELHGDITHKGSEESQPLLNFLFEHGNRPEFGCRFRWAQGSVAFWDNRCTKHYAVNDTGQFERHMRRVQICGDKPF